MKFATCLNCMDGMVQLPVIHWIKDNYGADYVDMITEAGMDGVLVSEDFKYMDSLLSKIDISLEKHHSDIIFVVGHYDCGGNPVDDETHKKQISVAVEKVKGLRPSAHVVGLWVSSEWATEKTIER